MSIFEEVKEKVEQKSLGASVGLPNGAYVQKKTSDVSMKTVRYVFNPYIVADCRDFLAPVGYDYLPNGAFIKLDRILDNVNTGDVYAHPLSGTKNNKVSHIRQPGQIFNDLMSRFGGAGLTELTSLRDFEDEREVAKLSETVLGLNIPSNTDVYNSDMPVPILPLWYESILENIKTAEQKEGVNLRKLHADLQTAFKQAIKHAQDAVDEANGRLLDPKASDKTLSQLERRAFLALGQEIPEQLASRATGSAVQQPVKPSSNDDKVARLEAEKELAEMKNKQLQQELENERLKNQLAEAKLQPSKDTKLSESEKCKGLTAKGKPCKNDKNCGIEHKKWQ